MKTLVRNNYLQVKGIEALYLYDDMPIFEQVCAHVESLNEHFGCGLSVQYSKMHGRTEVFFPDKEQQVGKGK
jgi:hypothetical protein